MPGSPPTTPNLGLPRYSGADPADYPTQTNAIVDALDTRPGVVHPPLVSSLPAGPVDGQECYFLADATNGVLWHLRYRSASASTYKWEVVGGGTMRSRVDAAEGSASGAYADLPTVGPQIACPLAGDYDFSFGFTTFASDTVPGTAYMAMSAANFTASDNECLRIAIFALQSLATSSQIERRHTVSAPGPVTAKYHVSGNSLAFQFRWVSARPIRVG